MKFFSISLLFAASFALSACNTDEQDLSGYLGVKVQRLAGDDYCVTQQTRTLINGFIDLSKSDQNAIRQKIQKYTGIDLLPPVPRRFLTGVTTELNFRIQDCGEEESCHDACYDRFGRRESSCPITRDDSVRECHSNYVCHTVKNETKFLENAIAARGTEAPLIQVTDKITLSPSLIDDEIHRTRYITESETFYRHVDSATDPAFKSAVENGLLEKGEVDSESGCGTPITIQELAKFLN
jgi:hypothetical protein